MYDDIYKKPSPGLFKLILAKGFFIKGNRYTELYLYPKTKLEKVGDFLRAPIGETIHFFGKNFRRGWVILCLVLLFQIVVTVAFFHEDVYQFLVWIFPFLKALKAWMFKALIYTFLQLTLVGICLRALGRISNRMLMKKYCEGELVPYFIGSVKLNK